MIENNLLILVLVTGGIGLLVPRLGQFLSGAVTPMLALLMLAVSLSFDATALREVLRRPGLQLLATLLVYGPMSLLGLGLATLVFGAGPHWLGVILLGTLPTDVSSPLLVWIGRGNVPLATVFNAVNTALAPLLVPLLFLTYTGVTLDVPAAALVGELALTVLLLAVVGPNAAAIIAAPTTMLLLAAVCLVLNVGGYLLATAAQPWLPARGDRTAMLFTVSKKEFSIAAVVVASTGLPVEVALPAVVYAVVQMLTSPVVANVTARRAE